MIVVPPGDLPRRFDCGVREGPMVDVKLWVLTPILRAKGRPV